MTRASSGMKVYTVGEGMRKLEELFTYSTRRWNCVTLLPASKLDKRLSNSGGWFSAACKKFSRLAIDYGTIRGGFINPTLCLSVDRRAFNFGAKIVHFW